MSIVRRPLFFGPQARPLFGWIHAPASGSATGLPVLLCRALGYEEECSHRALRRLADDLARRGLTAMVFDYDGCGDSAGGGRDPGRVGAWHASVAAAFEELLRRTGAPGAAIVGVRVGAALAARFACGEPRVRALVAFAPVVRGRTYLRELRAFQMGSPGAAEPASGLVEAGGYALDVATATELAAIDLATLELPRDLPVLVADRADRPVAADWCRALCERGHEAAYRMVAGIDELLTTPHAARVPESALEAVVDWLATRPAPASGVGSCADGDGAGAGRSESLARVELPASGAVLEAPLFLGGEGAAFGISTVEAQPSAGARGAILLLNAGAVHHVGPGRLYVDLARRWAAAGFWVVRVDLTGLGDSDPRPGQPDNVVYGPEALEDVAMIAADVCRRLGVATVDLCGLCSGAYHAFKASASATPVRRAFMINPLTFTWHEGMSLDAPLNVHEVVQDFARYQTSILSLSKWLGVLRGRTSVARSLAVVGRRARESLASLARDLARSAGVRLPDDVGSALLAAVRRGVALHFIFADGDPGLPLLRIQAGSALRRAGAACDIRVIDRADHTFTASDARQRLEDLLADAVAGPAAAPGGRR